MVFDSLSFFLFLAVALGVRFAPIPWAATKLLLTVMSYGFYAAWYPYYVLLLAFSTAVDWIAAGRMAEAGSLHRRRVWLAVSLTANLGLLGFFKYGAFAYDSSSDLLGLLGLGALPFERPGWALPVGISFYTFQTLSYTIDIYYGRLKPARSLVDFALFVSFFPQLVAGPIVRASHFLPQCEARSVVDGRRFGWGLVLLFFGLLQKDIADHLMAPIADVAYAPGAAISALDAWTGALAFTIQVLCDFSGYSICAIGVGMCLGFNLPDNFRTPYASIGLGEFWRRWHISLSTWLRDYVYIPLGGNRKGMRRSSINLFLTMLASGIWHGASWNFVIWGATHGILLVGERSLRRRVKIEWRPTGWVRTALETLGRLATVLVFLLTCVMFRAPTMPDAWHVYVALVGAGGAAADLLSSNQVLLCVVVTVLVLAAQWYLRDRSMEHVARRLPEPVLILGVAALVLAVLLLTGEDRAFVYFQF